MFAKVRANRHERSSNTGAPTLPVANANANRNRNPNTNSNPNHAVAPPLVSPLQMNFDFELPPSRDRSPYRISGESLRRPGTSDGAGSNHRKSGLSLTSAPVLPPIPRVASRYEPELSGASQDGKSTGRRARDESDNSSAFSFASRKSQMLHPAASFEHPVGLMPSTTAFGASMSEGLGLKIPGQEALQRPSTSGGSTLKMESSLFPPRSAGSPMLPPINSGPPMSRAFIDSRDKPYSHPSSRPSQQLQLGQSQSAPYMSPNMQSLQSPASHSSYSSHSPLTPPMPTVPSSATSLRAPKISGARLSPMSSVEDLRALQRSSTDGTMGTVDRSPASATIPTMSRSPTSGTVATGKSGPPTNYSGSTALPSPHSSVTNAYSPSAHSPLAHTIGTPYQTTSSSFPLPQHVATRPKTAGASATVAGVNVPTHHTSTPRPDSAAGSTKADKRKTRLLNPMALLTRRKSGQEGDVSVNVTPAERSAAAQAYARQKSVAAVGVSKRPDDFDPRIRGKVVHDFSAPRHMRRNFSYDAAEVMLSPAEERQLQSASSAPSVPALQHQQDFGSMFAVADPQVASAHSKNTSQSSSTGGGGGGRRSLGSPSMFRELLNEDAVVDATRRESSLNAERLENKGFLQRVSHHSSNSTFSQESAVLPPFARRSQHMDPMQAAFFQDDQDSSKRSSDRSSNSGSGRVEQRDSNLSSISEISPITARSSGNPSGGGPHVRDLRDSLGMSLSPVSPRSPEKEPIRPISAVSEVELPAKRTQQPPPASPEPRGRSESEATARPVSMMMMARPSIGPIAEDLSMMPISRERSPNRNSALAPEAVVLLPDYRDSSLLVPSTDRLSIPIPDRNSSLATTPELTPEIGQAESMPIQQVSATQSPAKLVEKRASAVGHASRRLDGLPRHQVSNASRFSFQFGGSGGDAEEEAVLEEKHRKIKGQSLESSKSAAHPHPHAGEDDEEGEEFDEGAMDDMDELEQAEQQSVHVVQAPPTVVATRAASGLMGLQHARLQLQAAAAADDSDDDGSVYDEDDIPEMTDERELTYAEHPAFRAHSAMASTPHSRNASQQTSNTWRGSVVDQYTQQQQQQYSPGSPRRYNRERGTSDASALTVNTTNLPTAGGMVAAAAGNSSGFAQDSLSANEGYAPGGVGGAKPRSGFYMQPKAAGYSPSTAGSLQMAKPPLPHRESGSSERNRVASGMSFVSAEGGGRRELQQSPRVVGQSTVGLEPAGGLGLSGLGDFNFREGPDLSINGSRPTSGETRGGANVKRMTRDSETIPHRMSTWAELDQVASSGTPPSYGVRKSGAGYFSSPDGGEHSAAYRGAMGRGIRARNVAVNQNMQYADSDSENEARDDMYFDDGGFEQDIKNPNHHHDSVDENEFDNSAFLQRARMVGIMGHQRDMSSASLGGDGPYPSFAMGANPVKARERQSMLLLEDLPLQGPVDPKLIPQRNPSEDAKRLGLSKKVPPLPVAQEGSKEAMMRMQSNLQAYHAALAEAANKAASDGRFLRQPSASSSTARSLSVYEKVVDDDKSHYSKDEHGEESLTVPGAAQYGLNRSPSNDTSGSRMDQSSSISYSPPKLDFDFGFNSQILDDGPEDNLGLDDDMVAAANGEVLASDDEGFYGQEFGFYAKARPNSSEAQAINGGFFGEDGDDGLARNKSLKEPNLTPITERSEFSTRNSFINVGHNGGAVVLPAGAAALHSPALARLPTSPLMENEVTSFDQLRKLRANAFGGSNGSIKSDYGPGGKGPGAAYAWHGTQAQSPSLSTKSAAAAQGYFGSMGGTPMAMGYSTESSGSSNPSSAHPQQAYHDSPQRYQFHDSPQSATMSSGALPFADAAEMTPRKPAQQEPGTARKASAPSYVNGAAQTHARKGSDSVTYVKEQDPANGGQPRWVLERRRTSEQGQLELVGREVVQGGWI